MNFLKKKISRRDFIKYSLLAAGGIAFGYYGLRQLSKKEQLPAAPETLWKWSKEAYHYRKFGQAVKCQLCPNECYLEPDDRGICRNRVNKSGTLYTLAYGNPCALHVDPVEKKPLFHFLSQTNAFSIATAGCNFRCLNCQNWNISQFSPEETRNMDLMPQNIVDLAINQKCESIAYTYSEPVAFYEYMYDISKIAKEKNVKNLWITNGYIKEKPLRELCTYIDAANVDLKSFKDSIYRELNGGKLKPILETLKILKEEKKWFEITNLVIPSWTDNMDMIEEMCIWLYRNGFENYPLHFSRFSALYKLAHLAPTPASTLEKARDTALKQGLKFVYIGNLPGTDYENTYCPKCSKLIIARKGYEVTENNLKDGACDKCGEKIPGVWA